MSVAAAWRTKSNSLSACYLLSSTFLVMLVLYTAEEVVFPSSKCGSCINNALDDSLDRVGKWSNIGRTRPLVVPRLLPFKNANVSTIDPEKPGRQEDNSKPRKQRDSGAGPGAEPGTTKDESQAGAASGKALPGLKNSGNGNGGEQKTTEISSLAPPRPPSVNAAWYYTRVYKHPEAKLRLLTAKDGAARIRSNLPPPEREITIVTQTSADRLHALEATCMTWGGAISVAVHVRLESEIAPVYELLKQMHTRVEENRRCRLDLQVVTEDGFKTEEEALQASYPVNALRNVALGMATTKLLFLLDADFKPSPRLHESLTEEEGIYQEILRKATEEQQLFVVAAFEAATLKSRHRTFSVPETMEELREGWRDQSIVCFHCHQSPTGHMPTKFEKFLDPNTTSPYSISYKDGFEPYVIGAADSIPLYDARFRGYGENKVSHLYACAVDGMGFQVLPNAFVFELPHPPSQARESYVGKQKDPDQRYRILGLYRQFKKEVELEQLKKDPVRYGQFLKAIKN